MHAILAVVLNIQEQLRTENDCANVPYSVCCIRGEGQALAFSTEIPEYQAIMVKQNDVEIVVTSIVNLASFLGGNRGGPVHHAVWNPLKQHTQVVWI